MLVECCEIVSTMFHIQQNNKKINRSLHGIGLWITTEKRRQFKQNNKVFPEHNFPLSFFEHNLDF